MVAPLENWIRQLGEFKEWYQTVLQLSSAGDDVNDELLLFLIIFQYADTNEIECNIRRKATDFQRLNFQEYSEHTAR